MENMLANLQGRVEVMEGKEFGEEKVSAQGSGLKHAGSNLDSGRGGGMRKLGWSRVRQGRGYHHSLICRSGRLLSGRWGEAG